MSGFDLGPVTGFDKFYQRPPQVEDGGVDVEGLTRGVSPDGGEARTSGSTFEGALSASLDELRALQDDVGDKYKGLVLGEDVELHDVMLAANKSEVMFNLMLEVRNKLVEAWEKLSRSAV